MTDDELNNRIKTLHQLCLLLCIGKPWGLQLKSTGKEVFITSHPANMGHFIGKRGVRIKALRKIGSFLGLIIVLDSFTSEGAETRSRGDLASSPKVVLADILQHITGTRPDVSAEPDEADGHYHVNIAQKFYSKDLEISLDELLYPGGYAVGDGISLRLVPV